MTIACFGFGASPKGDQTIDVPKDTSRVHFIGWTSIVVENSLGELDICGEYSPDEANLVRSLDPKYVESYGLILPQSDTKAKGVKPLRFYGLESLQGYLMPEGNIIGLCRNSSLATFQDEVLRTLHLYYRNAKDVAACGSSTDHLTVVIDRSTLDLHQWTASDPTPRSILQTATQDQAALLKDVAFERIWAGEAHMLALATDGTLYSWGSGRHGQLGHGDLMSLSIPKPIESLQGIRIVEAACGASFSVALSGDVYSFGLNDHGQLGIGKHLSSRGKDDDGERRNTSYPQLIDFYEEGGDESTDINVIRVACGRAHVVVLDDSGGAWSCGWGKYGQVGQTKASNLMDMLKKQEQLDEFYFKRVAVQNTKRWKDVVCGLWSTILWAGSDGDVAVE